MESSEYKSRIKSVEANKFENNYLLYKSIPPSEICLKMENFLESAKLSHNIKYSVIHTKEKVSSIVVPSEKVYEEEDFEKIKKGLLKKIRKSKVDLMILGVGVNGHIAFNEPDSEVGSKTRLVELKHKEVRKKALTIGISTILSAKKIILLGSGKKKEKAIKYLIKSKPNKSYPVSFLKKHKNLTVIIA